MSGNIFLCVSRLIKSVLLFHVSVIKSAMRRVASARISHAFLRLLQIIRTHWPEPEIAKVALSEKNKTEKHRDVIRQLKPTYMQFPLQNIIYSTNSFQIKNWQEKN